MDLTEFEDRDIPGGGHNEDITEKLMIEYEEFIESFEKYTKREIIVEHIYAINVWMELHSRFISEVNFDNVNEDILDWCRTVPNIMEHIFNIATELWDSINIGSADGVDEALQMIFVVIGLVENEDITEEDYE
jgi:hypothetical protein